MQYEQEIITFKFCICHPVDIPLQYPSHMGSWMATTSML